MSLRIRTPGGGVRGTLTFSYVRRIGPFFGVIILRIFFRGQHKIGLVLGVISIILGYFLKFRVNFTECGHFLGLQKKFRCLIFRYY